jgi:hypothetical protein
MIMSAENFEIKVVRAGVIARRLAAAAIYNHATLI